MCLTTISKEPIPVIKEAYKVFYAGIGEKPKLHALFKHYPFKKRRWLQAVTEYNLCADDGFYYDSGFHCYMAKGGAFELQLLYTTFAPVHRVLVKEVTCIGTQNVYKGYCFSAHKVLVCNQIYIMEEVK